MQKKQLTSLSSKNMTKARQKWKTSLVHAVSARFYKKVGARLLETRQHVMKMWISNVFSLSIIKAINLNWIVLLISCFCLKAEKHRSEIRVLFLTLTHGPEPLGKWFEHGFALSSQSLQRWWWSFWVWVRKDNTQGIAEYLRNQACAILAMVRYPFGGEGIML